MATATSTFIERCDLAYKKEDVLGKGGDGIVYKAAFFGSPVAVKVLYGGSFGDSTRQKSGDLDKLVNELSFLSTFRPVPRSS